jgi:hypothetical protein
MWPVLTQQNFKHFLAPVGAEEAEAETALILKANQVELVHMVFLQVKFLVELLTHTLLEEAEAEEIPVVLEMQVVQVVIQI